MHFMTKNQSIKNRSNIVKNSMMTLKMVHIKKKNPLKHCSDFLK